jgi:hypothetical protein
MSEPHEKDKGEAKEQKPKKSPEYRRFERILKMAVKTPPLRKESKE